MGILDFLRGGDGPSKGQIAKALRQVTQPHGDPAIRMGAADRLRAWGTPEAIAALLRRFTVQTPSGQTDLEEREQVMAMLVELGEAAVEPVVRFLGRESSVSYPARALSCILPRESFVSRILGLLEGMEAGFGSTKEQREGLIRQVDRIEDERIAPAMVRFLEDPSDDVAVAALDCIVHAGDESYKQALVELLEASADRPRVREEVAERLAEAGWPMQELKKQVAACLPRSYSLDKKGRVVRL